MNPIPPLPKKAKSGSPEWIRRGGGRRRAGGESPTTATVETNGRGKRGGKLFSFNGCRAGYNGGGRKRR